MLKLPTLVVLISLLFSIIVGCSDNIITGPDNQQKEQVRTINSGPGTPGSPQ